MRWAIVHEPTPEEIRQQCREIQAGWSEETERLRGAWAYECEAVEFPQARAADWPEAVEAVETMKP